MVTCATMEKNLKHYLAFYPSGVGKTGTDFMDKALDR